MIEISERKRERGGIGRAIKDFKESLECLKEDFYAVMDEFEEFGERDGGSGSYSGGGSRGGSGRGGSMGYRDDEDERYWKEREEDEEFGERRGVRGSGRRRRSNGRYY